MLRAWAGANWFWLLLPVAAAVTLLFRGALDWPREGRMGEAVLLFDWCVTIPALYAWCYWRQLSGRQLALRLLGLACLGVWVASHAVPPSSQALLPTLGWARTAGLIALAIIELRLVFAAMKLLFSPGATAEQVAEKSGAPPFIARLMVLEARFWRAVWRFVSGR